MLLHQTNHIAGGAFGFAWLFKRTFLRGDNPLMILELPPYQPPRLKEILRQMLERGWLFLRNAGTIILAISIVLWFLTTYPKHPDPQATADAQIAHSFAGQAGHILEPVIKPLGFDWRIGIGLITSFAAREVFVGTMSTIYSMGGEVDDENATIKNRMRAEINPATGKPMYDAALGFSLLIFYAFAMQCMSTLATTYRETKSWKYPLIQFTYMTALAYLSAFAVYQLLS